MGADYGCAADALACAQEPGVRSAVWWGFAGLSSPGEGDGNCLDRVRRIDCSGQALPERAGALILPDRSDPHSWHAEVPCGRHVGTLSGRACLGAYPSDHLSHVSHTRNIFRVAPDLGLHHHRHDHRAASVGIAHPAAHMAADHLLQRMRVAGAVPQGLFHGPAQCGGYRLVGGLVQP